MGAALLAGCVSEESPIPPSAELRAAPSIVIMNVGDSSQVTVEAFVGNDPESVRWSIGTVGAGLRVSVDSTFGQMYIGEQLTLPDKSPTRRFQITLTDSVETYFVVGGGTASLSIPVKPTRP